MLTVWIDQQQIELIAFSRDYLEALKDRSGIALTSLVLEQLLAASLVDPAVKLEEIPGASFVQRLAANPLEQALHQVDRAAWGCIGWTGPPRSPQ